MALSLQLEVTEKNISEILTYTRTPVDLGDALLAFLGNQAAITTEKKRIGMSKVICIFLPRT